jgi:hypothetical protein
MTQADIEVLVMTDSGLMDTANLGQLGRWRGLADRGLVRAVQTSAGTWYEITDRGKHVLRIEGVHDDGRYDRIVSDAKRFREALGEFKRMHDALSNLPSIPKAELARGLGLSEADLRFGLNEVEASAILDDGSSAPKDPA